jgi:tetratricopeptide (TPR) repeat protein
MQGTAARPAPDPRSTRPLSQAERRAYELGRRGWLRGDVDAGLAELRTLLRTRAGFADVHYMVGTLLERRGDLPGAMRSLEAALQLNPAYVEALLALASLCEQQGDFERCRALTERAQSRLRPEEGGLDPTTCAKLANLQAELGDALREAGELRDAVDAYRKALQRCPDFHDVRHRLALTLRDVGRPDTALAELRRVLRGNPHFLEAAVQLGVTLYSLGRSDEAREALGRVLERDPGREDAAMYLRLLGPGAPSPAT